MGRIGVIQEINRTNDDDENAIEFVVDFGGGDSAVVPFAGPPGDDSAPLVGDYAVTVDHPGDVGEVAVACLDSSLVPEAGNGEKRFVARDTDHNIVGTFWMYDDGKIRLENDNGYVELQADGTVVANGHLEVLV